MAEKKIQTRIQHKRDTAASWEAAKDAKTNTNFIPLSGELIVYEVDTEHKRPRLKIGDGSTEINNLPFIQIEAIKDGAGYNSLVIGEGEANGKYALVGGTTDKSLIKDIAGIDISILTDDLVKDALGERGIRLKNNLNSNPASVVDGASGFSFGTGNRSITALSMSAGVGAEAGSKGFYLHKITVPSDGTDITITLSTVQKPYYKYKGIIGGWQEKNTSSSWNTSAEAMLNSWAIGDSVTVQLGKIFCLCGSIKSINASTGIITISNTGKITAADVTNAIEFQGTGSSVTSAAKMAALVPYQFTVAVPTKPDIGIAEIHFASISTGLGSIAASTLSQAHGRMNLAVGQFSFVVGQNNIVGYGGFASGESNKALGYNAHCEGADNEASGSSSHAEGINNTAFGDYSHIEGMSVTNFNQDGAITVLNNDNIYNDWKSKDPSTAKYALAFGPYSHVEGQNSLALGSRAHAEGWMNIAWGTSTHAEGRETLAKGLYSHTEGYGTIASGQYQHVEGKYNIEDTSNTYLHIAGNGTSSKPSNAYTLDWSGNARFAGNVYSAGSILATQTFVNDEISTINNTINSINDEISTVNSTINTVKNSIVGIKSGNGDETFNSSTNVATGGYSHASNLGTYALGIYSHAEGWRTMAVGQKSHAEGSSPAEFYDVNYGWDGTKKVTEYTVQEISDLWMNRDLAKKFNMAYGNWSHTEGQGNLALATRSHVQGWGCSARCVGAHVEGIGSVSTLDTTIHGDKSYCVQHVEGSYNKILGNEYIHIAGCGSSESNRKNAYTLDRLGNAWFRGDIYVGGTQQSEGRRLPKVFIGTTAPDNSQGVDGDIYIMY